MFDLYCSRSLPLIPSSLFSLQGERGIVSMAVAEHPVYSWYPYKPGSTVLPTSQQQTRARTQTSCVESIWFSNITTLCSLTRWENSFTRVQTIGHYTFLKIIIFFCLFFKDIPNKGTTESGVLYNHLIVRCRQHNSSFVIN